MFKLIATNLSCRTSRVLPVRRLRKATVSSIKYVRLSLCPRRSIRIPPEGIALNFMLKMGDFRLPLLYQRDLPSCGILRNVD